MIKNSIHTFLLIVLLTGVSFGQDLQQSVTLKAENKTLEEIFQIISDDYKISFSYMNNELPSNRVDVDFAGISLDHALSNLLEGFGFEHVVKSGKVIIKKAATSPEIPQETPGEMEPDGAKPDPQPIVETVDSTDTMEEPIAVADSLPHEATSKPEAVAKTVPEQDSVKAVQVVEEKPVVADKPVERYNPRQGVIITYKAGDNNPNQNIALGQQAQSRNYSINEGDTIRYEEETVPLKRRVGHFGVFYPFSTNSYNAKDYVNNISLHLLAGYSGGLEGFEFAGVTSIIKGDGKGMQFSGISNITKGRFTGAQLSGVTNITWYDFRGLQTAGVANISYDRNLGMQIAGVVNVARGRESGFQVAGVVNMTYGTSRFGQVAGLVNSAWEVDGIQASGLVNISRKQNGLQVAPLYNQTGSIYGAQISGFMNKAGEVKGAQIAPFLNVAGKVHGVQIGLINISDEMHGTPIGLFCLAKRNGYFDFEMFYSDDFQANAAIKIGAPHFHNIFAFSYETDNKNRWAYGYGFGSQWGKGTVRLNTDIISYYVVEQELPNGAFRDFQINLLNRFRFLPSMHVGDFGVFAGPTLNFMVSENMDAESGVIGSDITPKPLWEETDMSQGLHGMNYKLWIGYNVGVRF